MRIKRFSRNWLFSSGPTSIIPCKRLERQQIESFPYPQIPLPPRDWNSPWRKVWYVKNLLDARFNKQISNKDWKCQWSVLELVWIWIIVLVFDIFFWEIIDLISWTKTCIYNYQKHKVTLFTFLHNVYFLYQHREVSINQWKQKRLIISCLLSRQIPQQHQIKLRKKNHLYLLTVFRSTAAPTLFLFLTLLRLQYF